MIRGNAMNVYELLLDNGKSFTLSACDKEQAIGMGSHLLDRDLPNRCLRIISAKCLNDDF
jgi:hypothetical protein